MKKLPGDSVDSLVTDPPAGINFMGLEFDSDKGGRDQWISWLKEVMQECLRVMKPGAHGFVWAIPRTSHWTATALEDAGFIIKDCVQHLFGQGFPKSHSCKNIGRPELGSALKPSSEFWWLVQKPLEKGHTIDKNVLKWGTGALQIDASRVRTVRCEETQDKLSVSSVEPNHGLDEVATSKSSVIRSVMASSGEEGSIIHSDGSIKLATSDLNTGMTQKQSTATSLSIGMSGERKSQQDTLSTTETKTNKTTDSQTLNLCEGLTTSECMQDNQTSTQQQELHQSIQKDGEKTIYRDRERGRLYGDCSE